MKNGMLALCAALISAGIAADAQEWLGDGYANRMRLSLTEKAAAGNLENFPVCVRLNGDELFSKIKLSRPPTEKQFFRMKSNPWTRRKKS